MNHQSQTKNCVNCKTDFTIELDDFGFYEKMDVPPPQKCPPCRAQLRLSFRNERSFYKRDCDKCKKSVVSMYSPNKSYVVWCTECWNAEDWDARDYGINYDSSKSFLEQFEEIWNKVPKIGLMHVRSINSEYLNICADSKNCYMIIESSNNEDCINCYWIQLSKDLVDCSFTNKVERSYESDDCYDSYGLRFCKGCHSCTDSYFLLDCRGCTDCIGCVNLRNKSNCIFNVEYSKEEYKKKKEELKLDTYFGMKEFENHFKEFIKDKPRKYAEITSVINSTGTYLSNVKNVKNCFHTYEAEDCKHCVHAWRTSKDNMDCDTVGRVSTNNYECVNTGQEASNNKMSALCWGTSFAEYSYHCLGSQELFGCIGIRQKKYCILNKQYTKEEYEKIKKEIISKMKIDGTYGEFFPKELSCFGYNESCVNEQYSLSKEEALEQGFKWEDTVRGTYDKETVDWITFPDSIRDLPKEFNINKEIFTCLDCKKNYRIILNELNFYKKNGFAYTENMS